MGIELLGLNRGLVAYLENATNVNVNETMNKPSECSATFQLPYNDPKQIECSPNRLVRITQNTVQLGLFRIIPRVVEHNPTGMVSIECEHVIASLLNNVMFGYHEVGNLGFDTRKVLEYILDKQKTKDWVLGQCDFTHQFQYGWENSTLLTALMSVPQPFSDEYLFTFETTTYPWTINLLKIDKTKDPQSYFRYHKNIQSIRKEEDASELCNRLYCLGYGEGINQLTIKSVNGGVPYLEDTASQAKYGLIERVWIDRRFEYPETLIARGQQLLDGYAKPRVQYTLDAVDLSPTTSSSLDRPVVGTLTRVIDQTINEDYKAVIVSVKRSDVFGKNPSVQIDVENVPVDLASTISEQADLLRAEQSYAQGATNIWSMQFGENADAKHPIIVELYIPADTKVINRVNLRWRAEAFRADVQSVAAGGGQVVTTSTQPTQTSSSGGGVNKTTSAGGGRVMSTEASSNTTTTGALGLFYISSNTGEIDSGSPQTNHRHDLTDISNDVISAIGSHTHGMQHYHSMDLPSHEHEFEVPNHTHTIGAHSHTVNLDSHIHPMQYGIFEGTRASGATLKVGTKGKSFTVPQNTDFDIVPYLEKDSAGLIKRGTSQLIYITPNALTRLAGTVTPQVFIQSRGGGNY